MKKLFWLLVIFLSFHTAGYGQITLNNKSYDLENNTISLTMSHKLKGSDATASSNYSLSNALNATGASLSADEKTITLQLSGNTTLCAIPDYSVISIKLVQDINSKGNASGKFKKDTVFKLMLGSSRPVLTIDEVRANGSGFDIILQSSVPLRSTVNKDQFKLNNFNVKNARLNPADSQEIDLYVEPKGVSQTFWSSILEVQSLDVLSNCRSIEPTELFVSFLNPNGSYSFDPGAGFTLKMNDDCNSLVASYPADVKIDFSGNGTVLSDLPNDIDYASTLSARVILDQEYWKSRFDKAVNQYYKAIENLNQYKKTGFDRFNISEDNITLLKKELANQILAAYDHFNDFSNEKQRALKKLRLLGFTEDQTQDEPKYVPDINTLIYPDFKLRLEFFNEQGISIGCDGSAHCQHNRYEYNFNPCLCGDNNSYAGAVGFYNLGQTVQLPSAATKLNYELILEDSYYQVVNIWSELLDRALVELSQDMKQTQEILDNEFVEMYKTTLEYKGKANEFLKKAGSSEPIDLDFDLASAMMKVSSLTLTADKVLNQFKYNRDVAYWSYYWLWYTNGVPGVNPYGYGKPILSISESSGSSSKTKEELESRVAFYKEFLNTKPFQLSGNFANSDKLIKAVSDQYVAAQKALNEYEAVVESPSRFQFTNDLLYKGHLYVHGYTAQYMRHHDATRDYQLMGPKPIREITEGQQLHTLAANVSQTGSKPIFKIEFESVPSDFSTLADELNAQIELTESLAFLIPDMAKAKAQYGSDIQGVKDFVASVEKLKKKIEFIEKNFVLPSVLSAEKDDKTPNFYTFEKVYSPEGNEYPLIAKYEFTYKNSAGEDEPLKANYRINKKYQFRFRAGLVYSTFDRATYTIDGTNVSSEVENHGIDATFGVQTYLQASDLRPETRRRLPTGKKILQSTFIYTGFSSKDITKNFYAGLGFEPYNGFSVLFLRHIGENQVLGEVDPVTMVPSINTEWQGNWSFGLAFDPALLVKFLGFKGNLTPF